MALKNRTEVKNEVNSQTAIHTETDYKNLLADEMTENFVLRKDVSDFIEKNSGSSETIDFGNFDYIEFDFSNIPAQVDMQITLDNVLQGEIKYLKVIKGASDNAVFVNAIDVTAAPGALTNETEILYRIINKDGTNIYVESESGNLKEATTTYKGIIEKATDGEATSGIEDKYFDSDQFQDSGVLKATTAEAEAGLSFDKWISPSVLSDMLGGTRTKIVQIGDWDMSSTSIISVPHGLAAHTSIRGISVIIRNDSDVLPFNVYDLNKVNSSGNVSGGIISITDTSVVLVRTNGGEFDNAGFNQTSYNRGWVKIEYIP